ncbi:cell division protein FtsN [Idiomarina tyrosinivorans]|uniref:Cell division protein FtsN n=1 Tax=Idiomarina tyrosinivorans TaxID=1445662 RepID=A0A432ZPW9_9GAMM|nr:SPOR domain-containing protein [Idiomarina tyrosinivorans]RUO79923.1 cell division protein FtsN [Idiomarina tyrosinivorans]
MDYANRGRPQRPKKPKKGAKSNAKKASVARRPVPWLIVLLAIALIALFSYFLISINGEGDKHPATVTPPAAQTKPQQQLPEKPKERWQYIEALENKEVEVDVPERELGPPKLMQCGSFRQQTDAEQLKAQIAMVGLEAKIYPSDGDSGRWYRVVLGPYKTKRAAESERHKLQRNKIYGCAIWNWNLD